MEWKKYVIKEDPKACYAILYSCVYSIINIANLLEPFIPFSTKQVRQMIGIKDFSWAPIEVPDGKIDTVKVLFERLEKIK